MICGFMALWLLSALLGMALLVAGVKVLKTQDPIWQNRDILQSPGTLGSEPSFPTDHVYGVTSDNPVVSEFPHL